MIAIYNTKAEYSAEEAQALEEAYNNLASKIQGQQLSIDDTRIIVAYKRYKQEQDFKIVATKVKKEKVIKEKVIKPKKKTKKQLAEEAEQRFNNEVKLTELLIKQKQGIELTTEEQTWIKEYSNEMVS